MTEKPRIYIEASPIIDLVKHKVGITPSPAAAQDTWYVSWLVEAAQAGDVELYSSMISIAECTHVSDPGKLEAAKPFFMGLLASGRSGFRLIQPTLAVMEKSRDLRWLNGMNLRGNDSIHVASALHLKCHEFLTGDDRILGYDSILAPMQLRVCKPSTTQLLPARYHQYPLGLSQNPPT